MRISIENLFLSCGVDYTKMKIGESIDVSEKNKYIPSYNIEKKVVEKKKILKLVRKEDSSIIEIHEAEKDTLLFKSTLNHKVFSKRVKGKEEFSWNSLSTILFEWGTNLFETMTRDGVIVATIVLSEEIKPILDMEIEDNHNYFANGVLSHNTTPGGNAVKFFSSIRLEVRRVEAITAEGNEDEQIGLKSRVTVKKNKTAVPNRKGEIEIYFSRGIDPLVEYIEFAIFYEIIKKTGNTYHYKEEKLGVGVKQLKTLFQKNEKFYSTIRSEVDELLLFKNVENGIIPEAEIEKEEEGITEDELQKLAIEVSETSEESDDSEEKEEVGTNNSSPKKRGRPAKK